MHRLLLIGDDLSVLAGLKTQPDVPPFEVEVAAGGVDAVRRLRQRHFGLVITSPRTSVDEDLAVLDEIREMRPNLPAILLASRPTREEVIGALRAHAFACFSAPFDWSEVATMVKAAFSGENWREGIQVLSATDDWITLRVQSRILTAERLVQFMRELSTDQPGDTRENLLMAFREILLNAMEHGTGFDPNQAIEVSAVRTERAIVYYFRDPGPGFSRQRLPQATSSNAAEDVEATLAFREGAGMRPGGFGMLIVRQLVDEVIYNETGNQVILVKHTK
jgi:anti-sigma regulatory factor (Ser/Thr protein kinase)/ActR/RegA family two-component response regulator